MRVRSIDVFRGLAVVLMVFFTIYGVLTPYQDLFQHNVPGSLHLGDFVLPMFLFASGMSLVFFAKKRESESRLAYTIDCLNRLTRLFLVSLFLAPFTAGQFLGMDVIMLNLLLSIPTLLLLAFPEPAIAAFSLLPLALYLILSGTGTLPDFSAAHLGGYPAAIFYLPIMLAGAATGKRISEKRSLIPPIYASAALSLFLLFLVPPFKMDASPSFTALSILLSLLIFKVIETCLPCKKPIESAAGALEYLGRNSIRYWVLMFAMLLAPFGMYSLASQQELPLDMQWEPAFALSFLSLALLYLASRVMDLALAASRKLIRNRRRNEN